jgi:hypothetical protein
VFLLVAKFRQISTWKKKEDLNLYKGLFPWENWPKFARFRILKNSKLSESYDTFQKGSQEYRRIFIFFPLPSYLLCSQIWLNYFLDDHHSGYVTKSLKETLAHTHLGVSPLQTKHMHKMIQKCIKMNRAKGRQGEKKKRSIVVYCLQ